MKRETAIALSIVCVSIGVVDAILKYFAIKRLPEEGSLLNSMIDFALHKNPGIAFDIPIPLGLVILLTLIITALLIRYAVRAWQSDPGRTFASIMVIIGAVGNMIDRFINGFTTDYIILFRTSAINLSDVLIILGTILILYYSESRTKEKIK
ncbi:MAG: signal peptidase II [Patescibacteria group bacterium]